MEFRLGELFSGPGGIALGALNAKITDPSFKITHIWASDYDKDACETYAHNICPMNKNAVIQQDVRQLNLETLPSINALAFGFPCNDFSIVGVKRGISGDYGPLYTYGVKALKIFKPIWFFAENVGGLVSANEGNAFQIILKDMRKTGYRLYPHLYKFEDYGIPQARHRIIIIGIREDIEVEFHVPSPRPYMNINNSCSNALENPPIATNALNNELTRQSAIVRERLQLINPGENAFNSDLPEHLRLKVKGAKISQIYKRLDPNKPAYTVTGSGGGGTHVYHYSEPRALTNRERARLQTFPDNYEFKGSKESVRKQIGMAVPCRGAQIIFEAVLNSFAGVEYDYVSCNISE